MNFKKGDSVRWTKHNKKQEGIVEAVVPANKNPLECISVSEIRKASIKPLGLITTLEPRDHESYLVLSLIGERAIKALYWPSVSALSKAD